MTTTADRPAAPPKRKRGRETVLDMVRTLAVVFALVVPMYLFGQGGPDDKKDIRAVDPTEALAVAAKDLGVPVPTGTPPGWTPTVRDTATTAGVVRVGYVVGDHYVEYAAGRGPDFLRDLTGRGRPEGSAVVAGVTWQLYVNVEGAESLVLSRNGSTVVVGGLRETGTRAELETLAASLR